MDSSINLSYHKRLFTLLLTCIWVIVFCFIGFQYVREKRVKSENLNSQLQLCNKQIIGAIADGNTFESGISACYFPFDEIRVTIIDGCGAVKFDSNYAADSLKNHLSRPEIQSAILTGNGFDIRRMSASDGKQYFYSATKGKDIIVRTAIPYTSSLTDILEADWTFLWVIIVISIAMSIVGYFSSPIPMT